MENTRTIFIGTDYETELDLFATKKEIFICIKNTESDGIFLNKDTAVKLSKHLKKEISYLD